MFILTNTAIIDLMNQMPERIRIERDVIQLVMLAFGLEPAIVDSFLSAIEDAVVTDDEGTVSVERRAVKVNSFSGFTFANGFYHVPKLAAKSDAGLTLIYGTAGSGKSTMCKKLSTALTLPFYYWNESRAGGDFDSAFLGRYFIIKGNCVVDSMTRILDGMSSIALSGGFPLNGEMVIQVVDVLARSRNYNVIASVRSQPHATWVANLIGVSTRAVYCVSPEQVFVRIKAADAEIMIETDQDGAIQLLLKHISGAGVSDYSPCTMTDVLATVTPLKRVDWFNNRNTIPMEYQPIHE